MKPTSLSKSKFLAGLRCPRLLWCVFNAPSKIPEIDESARALFDQGHEVGNLAKRLYPRGVEVERSGQSVEVTKLLLNENVPLFEASFSKNQAYCKVDVLNPNLGGWDLIEVKSSGRVKDEHVWDVAFQRYCVNSLQVKRCFVMHVDTSYVREGKIDPDKLLVAEDISSEVEKLLPEIEPKVEEFIDIIKQRFEPRAKLGVECLEPSDCPVCSVELPEVSELYLFRKKSYELINRGVKRIKDLPDTFKLNEKQLVQKKAVLENKVQVDKGPLVKFLKKLVYPLYFLDFETVGPAIPLFDGTRPFQAVPFQFSLHIRDEPSAQIRHVEFLADGPDDPRREVVEALKVIKGKGTVLAYNMQFEKMVISDLLVLFSGEKWLESIVERMEDLIIPFRSFWYYDPKQHGSNSIKAVLPALTGRNYEDLAISKGDEAARKFLAMNYQGKVNDKEKVRKDLLDYCRQDTQGMVDILEVLENAVR